VHRGIGRYRELYRRQSLSRIVATTNRVKCKRSSANVGEMDSGGRQEEGREQPGAQRERAMGTHVHVG
jgi:hypothetical protein